jgi:hypothetical protein
MNQILQPDGSVPQKHRARLLAGCVFGICPIATRCRGHIHRGPRHGRIRYAFSCRDMAQQPLKPSPGEPGVYYIAGQTWAVGTRYQLLKLLGEGSFSQVALGLDLETGEQVRTGPGAARCPPQTYTARALRCAHTCRPREALRPRPRPRPPDAGVPSCAVGRRRGRGRVRMAGLRRRRRICAGSIPSPNPAASCRALRSPSSASLMCLAAWTMRNACCGR